MINAATNKRYSGIEGLRAFSAIFVVLFHVLDRMAFGYHYSFGNQLESFFASFVSLFMMISAFSLCCGYYEKIKNNEISLNDFYKKRYIRILPLFLIVVILDIVFSGITKNNLFEGFANVTLLFGFLPHSNISIVGVGWTIGVIFAFYILFPFFVFAFWNKKRAWISLIISIIFSYISMNYYFDVDKYIHNIVAWFPYFSIGMIVYLYRLEIEKNLFNFRYIIWLFTISLLVINYINPFDSNKNLAELFILILDSFLLVSAVVSTNIILSNKVSKYLSNISFEIYLTHMMFIKLFCKIKFDSLFKGDIYNVIAMIVLVLFSTIAISFLIKKVLKKIKSVNL